MLRILLIRHASTPLSGRVLYGRLPGIHLNEEGLRQSREVAEAIRERYTLDGLISSPLERALETATAISKVTGIEVTTHQGLIEIDFGDWIGTPFSELDALESWTHFNGKRSLAHPPGGESALEVQARAWRSIQEIAGQFGDDSTLALVTHGDVVRSTLLLLLGMSLDHIHRLEIAPGSVSEVLIGSGAPLIRSVNQIFYAPGPARENSTETTNESQV